MRIVPGCRSKLVVKVMKMSFVSDALFTKIGTEALPTSMGLFGEKSLPDGAPSTLPSTNVLSKILTVLEFFLWRRPPKLYGYPRR